MIHRILIGLAVFLFLFMMSVLFAIVFVRLIYGADPADLSEPDKECSGSTQVEHTERMAPGRGVKNPPIPVDQYIYTRFYKRIQRLFIRK